MSKVTIRDIARTAGVGVGTVSRVLNNSPEVKEETRQKVLAIIKELNYQPSTVARQLSTGEKTKSVGIVVPFFTRPSSIERLRGIEAVLADSAYQMVLYNVETPEQVKAIYKRLIHEQRPDGLIIVDLPLETEHCELFTSHQLPVVLADTEHEVFPSITADDVGGGYTATRHLLELGHQHIAFISDDLDSPFGYRASTARFNGYQQALEAYDVPFNETHVMQGGLGHFLARQMVDELLELEPSPTAIFSVSDTQAIGVLEALRDRGLHVPENMSLTGFDDLDISTYVNLTTVRRPLYEIGAQSMHTLLAILESQETQPENQILPVSLMVRGTTASPRQTEQLK